MKFGAVILFSLSLVFATGCAQRQNSASSGGAAARSNVEGIKAEAVDRMNDSANILRELVNAPDDGIPEFVLKDAKCVAVVPSMIKGGFVIGGKHGRGVATCRTNNGWSAPAFFTISGGSWGAQIGAQAVDVVMMIMNAQGMQDLLSSKFQLGGEGSVAAGPVGRQASANTDYKLQAQVLTYSRARGLFAGLDLSGAAIRPDEETTVAFYGKDVPFRLALSGELNPPRLSQEFLASVRQSFQEARAASNNPQ
ncbi:MAG TPA: lipid-binding SYLF domain-containing protein [Terriglobales bacterium]|nr:lipid-binding SYLF domain-containing protein [Terriglobales bacterium]